MSPDDPFAIAPELTGTPQLGDDRMPTWAKVLLACVAGLVVLVLVGGLIGVVVYRSLEPSISDAEATSNSFIDTVQAEDPKALYALTDEMFREESSMADVERSLRQISSDLQGQEKVTDKSTFDLSEGQPTKAVVLYRIKTEGDPMYVRVVLAERGEDWKVVGFVYAKKPLGLEPEETTAP